MKLTILAALFVCVLVLSPCASAQAGYVLTEVRQGVQQQTYVQDNTIKFVHPTGQEMIFDLKDGQLCIVNHKLKGYWKGTAEDFKTQLRQSVMAQMEKAAEKMPPEQREAFKQAMTKMFDDSPQPGAPEPKFEVKATSEKADVAGYGTTKYEVWVDGQLREEMWMAEGCKVYQELDMKKMAAFMKVFPGGGKKDNYEASPEVVALYKKGWPLKTAKALPGGQRFVTETAKVEEKSIPASAFKAPDEYKAMDLLSVTGGPVGAGG
ncbi:MAG: DUF4412 domain-containing protein [Pseudomonadota bacterium]